MTIQAPAQTTATPTALPAPRPFRRDIRDVPLASLVLTKLNVRKHKDKDIESLAATIASTGLLQPIGVRAQPDGTHEVCFGERRTLAIRKLHKDGHPGTDMVPAVILEPGDDALAIEASFIENVERLPMNEMDQYEAFAKAFDLRKNTAEVAAVFGCTEQLVKRRLAIGNLIPEIRALYRREDISLEELQILTMATKARQKAYLKAHKDGDSPYPHMLREWLFGGQAIKTKVAIFDLADYKAPIANDLFGDNAYFTNVDQFWKLQNAAIAKLKDAHEASGWSEVHLLEPGQPFYCYNHVSLSKSKGGHVFISVRSNGEVEVHKGLISHAEMKKLERKADKETAPGDVDAEHQADTASRPELSEPLGNYIDLVRHSAVRAELAKTPSLALRLAVAQLIAGSQHWSISAEDRRSANDAIAKAVKDLPADKAFKEIRAKAKALLPNLKHDASYMADKDAIRSPSHGARVTAILAHLQTLSDNDVLAILAALTAETLALGTTVVDVLGQTMGVDITKTWQPDDAFFDLNRDREVINAMLSEVIGKEAAASYLTGTGKSKKEIIRKALTGDGRKKVEGWLPRWMAFPGKAYTKRPLTKRPKPTA